MSWRRLQDVLKTNKYLLDSDAYIVVKGRISDAVIVNANRENRKPTCKNNAPFRSCILKINNTFIDNEEDLDIVKPMYNLLEYSDNYSMTSRFWNYNWDEANDDVIESNAAVKL